MKNKDSPDAPAGLRAIPRGVWALGLVSLFMDTSSELIHSLLPVFLVTVLGASAVAVGFIEGIAEATASITKVFSGVLSDYLRKRKLLTVIGYGLASATKPLFPLASSVTWVFSARILDRIGKGIRGAPRDALIADITPEHLRGAAYGLRQSLDTFGAFMGPLLAIALMLLLANDIRTIFWLAVIPALIAMGILILGVREPEHSDAAGRAESPIQLTDLQHLNRGYWSVVIIASLLSIARFSEAFLVLRAQSVGLLLAFIPVILLVMNAAYTLVAYPAGALSDRIGRRIILAGGFVTLIVADVSIALAAGIWGVLLGAVLWGFHMGLTQGLLAAMVADTVAPKIRGSAFGIFNLVTGLALLGGNVVAGILWDQYGPTSTFFAGAGFTTIALAGLVTLELPRGHSET